MQKFTASINFSLWLWLTLACLLILLVVIWALQLPPSVGFRDPQISIAAKVDGSGKSNVTEAQGLQKIQLQIQVQKANEPDLHRSHKTSLESPLPQMTDPLSAVHQVENRVYQRADLLFENEATDFSWAPDFERSLNRMFALDEGLVRVSINQISCHATMCQILIYTPQSADADYFTAMFYRALASFENGTLKSEAAIARNMESGITSVYVARKGYELSFY